MAQLPPLELRRAIRLATDKVERAVHLDTDTLASPLHHKVEAVALVQHHLLFRTQPKRGQRHANVTLRLGWPPLLAAKCDAAPLQQSVAQQAIGAPALARVPHRPLVELAQPFDRELRRHLLAAVGKQLAEEPRTIPWGGWPLRTPTR